MPPRAPLLLNAAFKHHCSVFTVYFSDLCRRVYDHCGCYCVSVCGLLFWLRPTKAVADILVKRFVCPIKMMKRPFISVALWPGADRSFTLTSVSTMRQHLTNRSAGSRPILDNTQYRKHTGVGTQTRLFTSNFISS